METQAAPQQAQKMARQGRVRRQRSMLLIGLSVTGLLFAIYGAWSRRNPFIAVAYVAVAISAWLALTAHERRRHQVELRAIADAARTAAEGERLALALHGGDLALWDAHVPSGMGTVNDRWYSMLGYQPAEISSDLESWKSLLHPDDRERVLAANDKHLAGVTPSYEEQYRLRHRDGHWVWVLDRGRVVERDAAGSPLRMVGTHMDITERVESENRRQRSDQMMLQALRDTEARLRMAGRLARLGDWRYDVDTDQLCFSPDIARDPAGEPDCYPSLESGLAPIKPFHRERFRNRLRQALADGEPFEDEVDALLEDGRTRRLLVLGEVARDSDGRVVALQGALQDVTEARQAQQQLRLLEAAVSGLNDMVVITDGSPLEEPGPPIVFVNDAFERLTGWRREEVLGRSPRFLQGADTEPAELARIERALAAGQAVHSELVNYTREGRPYWVDIALAPLLDGRGQTTHIVSVHRDISDRRQAEYDRRALERQLREAQKIESIGTLAGGIAHDFNNILAAILGNVALARSDLPEDHGARISLEQIHKASLRARSLVQQILSFSRRQLNPLGVQQLRPIVEETLALLRATLPAAVRVDTALAEEPLWLKADATQIQQVLMNLCTNAWHALDQGRGRIEIGCASLPAGAPELIQEPGLAYAPAVHLWVRDDGSGMDDDTLERIFDPFYTTKPVGQGTGLGLSVVHGIVRNHGGVVRVDSRLGHGTCFHLYFPMAPAPGAQLGVEPAPPEAGVGGGQQVLYVDDDEVMLLMVERLLQRAGYGVVVCQSAEMALALVRERPERFDLVVSDYNMPEASGIELARRLVALRPGLPIIISSGFVTEELHAQAMTLGVRALLHKEKTLEELPGMVQRVLQGLAIRST